MPSAVISISRHLRRSLQSLSQSHARHPVFHAVRFVCHKSQDHHPVPARNRRDQHQGHHTVPARNRRNLQDLNPVRRTVLLRSHRSIQDLSPGHRTVLHQNLRNLRDLSPVRRTVLLRNRRNLQDLNPVRRTVLLRSLQDLSLDRLLVAVVPYAGHFSHRSAFNIQHPVPYFIGYIR
ncbi:DUF3106 domain-containing protein [Jutongia huaianensis]|uniref:DUF3106 domain-containing protein n=1 Tax=Jutongia huaianensis TaxID=2763668 RepID=A0ABR7N667_9FIRM|nr:DUF3106 domain-containing protein [Jutongia huaianensis]